MRLRWRAKVKELSASPVVSMRFFSPGGARTEPKLGLAVLAGRLLSEGTQTRNRFELVEELEGLGISLDVGWSLDGLSMAIDAPHQHWKRALSLGMDVLLQPSFPADRLAWAREKLVAELSSLADEPGGPTAWRFASKLLPGRRAAYPLAGDAESLASISRQDLESFHRRAVGGEWLVSMAGRCVEGAFLEHLSRSLNRLGRESGESQESSPVVPASLPSSTDWIPQDVAQQVHLHMGRLTVRHADPDLVPLAFAAVALGEGPGLQGRIPYRVREQAGLAYLVDVAVAAGACLSRGRFEVHLVTSAKHVERARDLVVEELERIVAFGVTTEEFEAARRYLLGAQPFRRETAPQWADLLLDAQYYQTPYDDSSWVRQQLLAVREADVARVIARHLSPDGLVEVQGGGPKGAGVDAPE